MLMVKNLNHKNIYYKYKVLPHLFQLNSNSFSRSYLPLTFGVCSFRLCTQAYEFVLCECDYVYLYAYVCVSY